MTMMMMMRIQQLLVPSMLKIDIGFGYNYNMTKDNSHDVIDVVFVDMVDMVFDMA
jgi:hypothetical protein